MLICIESFHQKELDILLPLLKDSLQQEEKNIRFIQFPSAGPFGHQLRVVESGRLEFHQIPDHLFRMVDRMDIFLNPINGVKNSIQPPDLIILSESQYKEALCTQDEETLQWVIEINKIIPSPQKLYWLVAEGESISPPIEFPPLIIIRINSENMDETVKKLAENIMNEVSHA